MIPVEMMSRYVYGFVSAKVLLCILVQATKAPSDEWGRDDPAGEAVEAWVGIGK